MTVVSPYLTYSSLYQNLLNYAQRTQDAQYSDQIPFIIQMAQSRISYDLNVLGTEKIVTGVLNANTPTLLKPSNLANTISITVQNPNNENENIILEKRLTEYLSDFLINNQFTSNHPIYYSDNSFYDYLLAPIPVVDVNYKLIYHEYLQPLSDINQTNWITERAPHLLLYACLRDSCVFFNAMQEEQWFAGLYREALENILKQDSRGQLDRSGKGVLN